MGGLLRDTDTEITIRSHKLPGQGEYSFDAWMCKIQPKHLLSSSSPSQSPGSSRLGAGGLMNDEKCRQTNSIGTTTIHYSTCDVKQIAFQKDSSSLVNDQELDLPFAPCPDLLIS